MPRGVLRAVLLPLPKLASEPFLKLWEQEVFALLLAEGKITEEVVGSMRSWKHSGFSVDQSVRLGRLSAAAGGPPQPLWDLFGHNSRYFALVKPF